MTARPPVVVAAIAGPARHGVVRHARTIADLTASVPVAITADAPIDVPCNAVVHVHYTDQLFGPDAAAAAARFRRLTAPVRDRLVVTLHDVPVIDGSGHGARRAAAYRSVAADAAALIVSSGHERRRLAELGIHAPVSVIPLPVPAHRSQRVHRATLSASAIRRLRPVQPTIGVLGFVYPGKGHESVIDAVAGTGALVLAIGAPSAGHEDLVDELGRRAAQARCALHVTGHVDDRRLESLLARVDVPVAPAAAPSASASIARWIGAGRRPLAAASAYTDELVAIGPDLVTRYAPDDLGAAIQLGLRAPRSTHRRGPIPAALRPTTVAQLHRAIYRRVVAGAGGG